VTGAADQRAVEALEHLQAAAVEMIEAARAFLDVAEELVTDPEQAASALASLTPLVDLAAALRRRAGDGAGSTDHRGGPVRVQHFDVT
jgi:hypothetical protein